MMKKRLIIPLIILFGLISNKVSAFVFTINEVVITNASCPGSGTLQFNPTGTIAGSTMTYTIYKLPNITTPYFVQTASSIGGLVGATYRIVATETVGGVISAPQTVNATVVTTFRELDFTYTIVNQACASFSDVTINVTTGIAASTLAYSISGPVTYPPQTSNVFTGLPNGNYTFTVVDACGNTKPKSNIPVIGNINGLTIAPPTFAGVAGNCAQITVNNLIVPNAGTQLGFPLTIQYTFTPPAPNPPVIINTTQSAGNGAGQVISQTVPFYPPPYTYTVSVKDSCPGAVTVVSPVFNIVNNITLTQKQLLAVCDKYFEISVGNFSPPFTLNFISAPATFNPVAANASYPGPYNTSPIIFGGAGNAMPQGTYIVNVLDACGKSMTVPLTFKIDNKATEPSISGVINGCLATDGNITVTPFSPRKLVSAMVMAAPTAYLPTPPHNVTANINSAGILYLDPVPLGGPYNITVVDDCGDSYDLVTNVNAYVNKNAGLDIRSGCDVGKATIAGWSNNGKVTSVIITSVTGNTVPLPFTPPFDASANIVGWGAFYLDNLPTGLYTFDIKDECNITNTVVQQIDGYSISRSVNQYITNCGSFDVNLDFISKSNSFTESFWLQQKINATDWGLVNGFPLNTSVVCPPNTVPNLTNSRPLSNNTLNPNFQLNGTFRIVRAFRIYNNGIFINAGNSHEKNCAIETYPEFTFSQALDIIDGYKAKCNTSGIQDVVINAVGIAPLTYKVFDVTNPLIAPIPVAHNPASNTFTGLPLGTYRFQVGDACGHTVSRDYQIASMTSLVTIAPAFTANPNMTQCATNITNLETFNLNIQTPIILGSQDSTKYTVTYFRSLSDAQGNTNVIATTTNFDPPLNPFTVYARVIFNGLPLCYETTSFTLTVTQTPKSNLFPLYQLCTTNSITLNPDLSNTNPAGTTYNWTNGITTTTAPTYTVNSFGETNLTVTASTVYGTTTCTSAPKAVKIIISQPPKIDHCVLDDWTDTENSIVVFTTLSGNYEYSIDGINYQDSNVFTNLPAGVYTVTVNDKFNCGKDKKEVWLLHYPRFFTPNGDGVNDYWAIPDSRLEKDLRVEIFDKYGQLMTSFYSKSLGWDGKFNNEQAISDDYWFIVYRQDGRIYKGHFAMKR